jgi:hypothetical protein
LLHEVVEVARGKPYFFLRWYGGGKGFRTSEVPSMSNEVTM